jgi:Flp pilus assembly protein TadG
VHVLVAVLIPVILGMAGLALDMGNLYLAQTRLQAAVDAGALAGALQLPYDPDLTKGVARDAAINMVKTNYEEAQVQGVTAGTDVRSLKVTATAQVKTMLMEILGVTSNQVSASAVAGFNNLEVVLVIDNTGSMKGTPISRVREAADDLVDLIIPDGAAPNTRIGLVPFRGKVKVLDAEGFPSGCLNADGSKNVGIHPDLMYLYNKLPSYQKSQVNLDTCTDIPPIQALTTDKDSIHDAIGQMDALGAGSGTVISEGLKWGRNVLSPEAPYTQGSNDPKVRKIMIVLTDGDTEDGTCGGSYAASFTPNNYWTNAYYGMKVTDCHCNNGGCLNAAMLTEAQTAKDAGIEIFSIRFGDSDSTDIALMKQIASSRTGTTDHYFNAPSAEDIPDVFKLIGKQLGWRLLN